MRSQTFNSKFIYNGLSSLAEYKWIFFTYCGLKSIYLIRLFIYIFLIKFLGLFIHYLGINLTIKTAKNIEKAHQE
jgi:hypothetical protein